MTRGQYIAMCIIGGVAIVAYLESVRIGQVLAGMLAPPGGQTAGPIST